MPEVRISMEHLSPLGQATTYTDTYTPSLLFSMLRSVARARLNSPADFEWHGEDIWHGYEFTWLDRHGKPVVAGLRLRIPCSSPCIIESKSLKLYLGSFAQTRFNGQADVLRTLDSDIRLAVRGPLTVELIPLRQLSTLPGTLPGICLDDIDCDVTDYTVNAGLLRSEGEHAVVNESVHSNLFRSLCPVTGQPDYATVWITYRGAPLARKGLLQYLVSYRQHQGFHEAVIEQIFMDLWRHGGLQTLSVMGCFQRRGGLDINPYRSSDREPPNPVRLPRQ